jgi:rhamnogalacturonan endolyase
MRSLFVFGGLSLWVVTALAALDGVENSTSIVLSNDRLAAVLDKSVGQVVDIYLDGQDLLGTRDGSTGIGPYMDCYCILSGFYTAGSTAPSLKTVQGPEQNTLA